MKDARSEVGPVNDVRLVGRVSAVSEPRELPSGDHVVTFRVVVPRPTPTKRRAGSGSEPGERRPRTAVDAIEVACWSASTRRRAGALRVDDEVVVEGALRRRFFRTGAGAQSRYEVEARSIGYAAGSPPRASPRPPGATSPRRSVP